MHFIRMAIGVDAIEGLASLEAGRNRTSSIQAVENAPHCPFSLARHAPTGTSATWRIKGLGGVTFGAPGYAHRLLFIDITHVSLPQVARRFRGGVTFLNLRFRLFSSAGTHLVLFHWLGVSANLALIID